MRNKSTYNAKIYDLIHKGFIHQNFCNTSKLNLSFSNTFIPSRSTYFQSCKNTV